MAGVHPGPPEGREIIQVPRGRGLLLGTQSGGPVRAAGSGGDSGAFQARQAQEARTVFAAHPMDLQARALLAEAQPRR